MTTIPVECACLDCIYARHDLCTGMFSGGLTTPCMCAGMDHRLPIETATGFVPPADVQSATPCPRCGAGLVAHGRMSDMPYCPNGCEIGT